MSGEQPTCFASHLVTVCYLEGRVGSGQVGVVSAKAAKRLLASTSKPIRTVAAELVRKRSNPSAVRVRQPVDGCQ